MTPATSLSTPGLLRLARDLVKVSVVVVRLSVRTERGRSLADILHLLTVMTLAALHSELYPLPLLINYVDVIAS